MKTIAFILLFGIIVMSISSGLLYFKCSKCGTEWQKLISDYITGPHNGFPDACPKCKNIEFGHEQSIVDIPCRSTWR